MSLFKVTLSLARTIGLAAITVALVACNSGTKEYPFSRDSFMGGINGKTMEEVIAKLGDPKERTNTNPEAPTLTYFKMTFDSSDQSKDPSTTITFKKDASGKFVVDKIEF
jgi:hypothetical protein